MTFLPKLRSTEALSKVENIKFYGLDKREYAQNGYFSDMGGMTSSDYPFFSSRNQRYVSYIPAGMKLLGISGAEKLCFVINDGKKSFFYYDGELKGEWEDTSGKEKFFCRIGRYIYIFPDRRYYRIKDENAIKRYNELYSDKIGAELCSYVLMTHQTTVLKKSSSITRLKVLGSDILFKEGDAVKIWAYDESDKTKKIPFFGLNMDMTFDVSDNNTLKDVYFYLNSSEYSNTPYWKYGDDDPKAEGLELGEYIKIGYSFTAPAEYGEEFGVFADENEFEIVQMFRQDADSIYLCIKNSALKGTAWFLKKELEKTFDAGLCIEINGYNDVLVYEGISGICTIEEFGVKEFFYKNNTGQVYAYFKISTPDSKWKYTKPSPYETEKEANKGWVSNGSEDDVWYYKKISDDDESEFLNTRIYGYPALDGACGFSNRLWGFSGDTVYASALGKPHFLTKFSGISTDSWSLELGRDRIITGIIPFNGAIHIFTENSVIKIFGESPSTFRTSETELDGVKNGSKKSLVMVGGVLYYLASSGVIAAYTGSYPTAVSVQLNSVYDFCMSAAGERYIYFLLEVLGNERKVYIFDTWYKVWVCDGSSQAKHICAVGEDIVLAEENTIISSFGQGVYESFIEGVSESFLEFPVNDEGLFNQKKLKKILLKVNVQKGTSLKVELKEADNYEYTRIFERFIKEGDGVLTIPVPCKRTLGYSVRISGKGKWRLEGVMRRISIGSCKE